MKQSMDDQLRTGTLIYLGKTTYAIFPIDTLVQYLAVQGGTLDNYLCYLTSNHSWEYHSFHPSKAFQELHMEHCNLTPTPIILELVVLRTVTV